MNALMVIIMVSVFSIVLLMAINEPAQAGSTAQVIVEAHATGGKVSNPTSSMPDLTFDQAYEIQAQVVALEVEKRGGQVGYKVAMTGEAAQKKFGVSEPTYGVLMKDMMLEPGVSLKTSDFKKLLIEVEIALIIGRDITGPLADLDEARAAVEAAAPAIELPEMRMADPASAKAVDVVADMANACRVILGPKADLKDLADINQVKIKLLKDGQLVNEGQATDSSGDQFKTLMWLAEAVTSRGGQIKKGQVIITGAMGQLLPGEPGQYQAEYGSFGQIDFTLE